jgi:hypothetical protein
VLIVDALNTCMERVTHHDFAAVGLTNEAMTLEEILDWYGIEPEQLLRRPPSDRA